jgi:hypothetical protein
MVWRCNTAESAVSSGVANASRLYTMLMQTLTMLAIASWLLLIK